MENITSHVVLVSGLTFDCITHVGHRCGMVNTKCSADIGYYRVSPRTLQLVAATPLLGSLVKAFGPELEMARLRSTVQLCNC